MITSSSINDSTHNRFEGIPSPIAEALRISPMRSFHLTPVRVLWKSPSGVRGEESLLKNRTGQSVLGKFDTCFLASDPTNPAGILLDFGVEIHGYVELFTPQTTVSTPAEIRIRFGESVGEAMSDLGGRKNAQNDHAIRDQIVVVPSIGQKTVGPSGFRFVRIDATPSGHGVELLEVRAVLVVRDIPTPGHFLSSNPRLNNIWSTGAYTVRLNMQEYLWDGIKRDRLVWVGDMHPEISTINAVFGYNEVVPKSLDLSRDICPPDDWMNSISSYSIWWLVIQRDWWVYHGRRDYLEDQRSYTVKLLRHLTRFIDKDGIETLDGVRFLDWPTVTNEAAIHEGLQSLMIFAFESGQELCSALGENAVMQECHQALTKLRRRKTQSAASKQSASLLYLSGLISKEDALSVIEMNGPKGLSTFYGFYVLEALAKAGRMEVGLEFVSRFWGAMIDYGATTFWEDFNLDWLENASRIDELPLANGKDLHGDFGDHCYQGFRHSLCHGWASGPTAWLSRHVLGIRPLEPGFRKVEISPKLGSLEFVEGAFPTPHGAIHVKHQKTEKNIVETEFDVPTGVEVVNSQN